MRMPSKKVTGKSKTTKALSTVKKTTPVVKKTVTAKTLIVKPKTTATKATGLTVKVYDTAGKSMGTTTLPAKIFGAKINKPLLAQALRIYFNNSKTHMAHTKTRGEVRGGGRKPWKQKGTGNARAGSKRSPLWVGGGITFGPRTRDAKLELPKKMKKAALISALSAKAQEGTITIISNFEKIAPKTKNMANLIAKIEAKTPLLIITSEKSNNVHLAARNIKNTKIEIPSNLNILSVWNKQNILISKDALEKFV